jgi:hypothetical protein
MRDMDLDSLKVDRTRFSVARLEGRDDSLAYWLSRPVEERLDAIELLRQAFYDYSDAGAGLQKILEVALSATERLC